MRQSKQKALEIEQAEHDSKQNRSNGLSLAEIRDRGWSKLSNGIMMEWHIDRPMEEGEVRRNIPEGFFVLDGKVYELDEFNRFLRWA